MSECKRKQQLLFYRSVWWDDDATYTKNLNASSIWLESKVKVDKKRRRTGKSRDAYFGLKVIHLNCPQPPSNILNNWIERVQSAIIMAAPFRINNAEMVMMLTIDRTILLQQQYAAVCFQNGQK